jgi:hypothetical protein
VRPERPSRGTCRTIGRPARFRSCAMRVECYVADAPGLQRPAATACAPASQGRRWHQLGMGLQHFVSALCSDRERLTGSFWFPGGTVDFHSLPPHDVLSGRACVVVPAACSCPSDYIALAGHFTTTASTCCHFPTIYRREICGEKSQRWVRATPAAAPAVAIPLRLTQSQTDCSAAIVCTPGVVLP